MHARQRACRLCMCARACARACAHVRARVCAHCRMLQEFAIIHICYGCFSGLVGATSDQSAAQVFIFMFESCRHLKISEDIRCAKVCTSTFACCNAMRCQRISDVPRYAHHVPRYAHRCMKIALLTCLHARALRAHANTGTLTARH